MEPDDINGHFSNILKPDINNLVIPFTGAKLPERDNVISLMSTGTVAEKCNNKWWQYCCFRQSKIHTPQTYHYNDLEAVQSDLSLLMEKHGNLLQLDREQEIFLGILRAYIRESYPKEMELLLALWQKNCMN